MDVVDAPTGAPIVRIAAETVVQIVALILTAFGVPFEEAERISREEAASALRL